MTTIFGFDRVVLVDFEFAAAPGECPTPWCLVWQDFAIGEVHRHWYDELRQMRAPPFSTGPETLFVGYYTSAEIGCYLALGWPVPERVLDLYVEFSLHVNGCPRPDGKRGLAAAMHHFGLDGVDVVEKESMRDLAMRGAPFAAEERRQLLDYCQGDVEALYHLLPRMAPHIDLPRALLRGRYMSAVARVERNGTPVDLPALTTLRDRWDGIRERLIRRVDADFNVFDGTRFVAARWEAWTELNNIPWPRLPSGAPDLKDSTFKQMAAVYPQVRPMRELRSSLSKLKLNDLAVGADGRNRTLLSPFRSRTGRNQPSSTRFIFGPSTWLRGLIRPLPGWGLAYVDFEQQELGIAAALSRDPAMQAAYRSGSPYLAFAIKAGAAPAGATKASHPLVRERYKQCSLGVLFGMGARALASRIGKPLSVAEQLLRHHRETYTRFWIWAEAAVDHAMLKGSIFTPFGWTLHVDCTTKPTTLRNFPMQGAGADMLRLACCLATERGIRACAPVHDALLVEAPLEDLDDTIHATREAMAEASDLVLDGFTLRTDVKTIRSPERYMDHRGREMWELVWDLIGQVPG